MHCDLIKAAELDSFLRERWRRIQISNDYLSSPYFCVQFTQATAAVRNDVYVGVICDGNTIVGFFPFHRKRLGTGRPVALGLSDYHGVICEPTFECCATELLRACGLSSWKFDHLLPGQSGLSSAVTTWDKSPIIRLEQGLDAWQNQLDARARKQQKEVIRKQEKLEREIGPVKFVADSDSQSVLQTLISWKSAQCRETGVTDYLSIEWTSRLLRLLHGIREPDFQGMLSALYSGDQLVAAHFGMRSRHVWHFWLPSYCRTFQEWSPGSILLNRIIQEAATRQIKYIDLGKGVSTYKQRVMNDFILVGQGCARRRSLLNQVIACGQALENIQASAWMRQFLSIPARAMRRIERCQRYQ